LSLGSIKASRDTIMRLLLLFCLGWWMAGARAERILFRGAEIHTAAGGVLANAELLIDGRKIIAVGPKAEGAADRVVDLAGKRIYPGLIAAATPLGLVEIEMIRSTVDTRESGEFTPDVRSWLAVNPDSELLPVARANGITHIVPVPAGGLVPGLSGVVALHGWTVSDMTVHAPAALHLSWPSMQLDTTPKEHTADKAKFKTLEEQAKARAAKLLEISDFFGDAEAYARARAAGAEEMTPAWEAMRPFEEGKIPLMIHADEYRQIKAALAWAAERNYRIIIAGARDAWMLAEELAKQKVPVIYERVYFEKSAMQANSARDVDAADVPFKTPALLHKAGVKLALGMGTDLRAGSEQRNLPYIAAQAAAHGLPEEEAVKAITLHPAEMLGVADRLGSIEPGKEASFVVADGSILDIRTRVLEVWIAGEKTSLETRHTRLYEKYKNRPRAQP